MALTAGSATAMPPEPPLPGKSAAERKPTAVFPVVGPARYYNDFGEPRHQGAHQGIDIMSPRRALAVAVEDGTVKFESGGWGCMLYLVAESGTKYVYIHLNNDLTKANDNRGRCVPGVSFARGLKSGQRVEMGQHIAYVGDSGDADGIHPHLHFEKRPGGGAATNPFRWLNGLPRLLFSVPLGTQFTASLRGTVETTGPETLRLRLQVARPWPVGAPVAHKGRPIVVAVPPTAVFETATGFTAVPNLGLLKKGQPVVVWTEPAAATVRAQTGKALVAERIQLLTAAKPKG